MSDLHVLFRVAETDYVVPADDVEQMESFASATRIPGALPHVAGLMQIRGRVVPVVDLRIRFGLPPVTPGLDSRVVVVRQAERTVGLLVDSAREVVRIPPEELRKAPDVAADSAHGYVKAVGRAGKRLVMLIDLEKVIGKEQVHGE